MPPFCPLAQGGGGYRGPPPPLILAPIIYQLVRRSCDPKMVAYVKELVAKQGPQAVADNAHKIVQYTLSKVPANVLYWFTSRVLNLPPETAMQTTEFLKSRTEIEMVMGEQQHQQQQITTTKTPLQLEFEKCDGSLAVKEREWVNVSASDIERRLERLEMDYQALQEKHYESMKLLTSKPENMYLPRELPLPDSEEQRLAEAAKWIEEEESTQLMRLDSQSLVSGSSLSEVDGQALLQNVGLRVGRAFLEWAGDTIKQTLVSAAAAKASVNQPLAGAGADLAGRLVDAIIVREKE